MEDEKLTTHDTDQTAPSSTDDRDLNKSETAPEEQTISDQDEPIENQEVSELKERVASLEAALSETKNRFLRAQADLENLRRRTRLEKEEQAKYAAQPTMKALLPALDNLERAIAASREAGETDSFSQGVEMVYKQIIEALEQEGLQEIDAVGQPFDPQVHEAVMQVDSDTYEPGTVVEELQKGYQLKDRVLRPSMVQVSK